MYKITQRGTHYVPLSKINDDILTPGEIVLSLQETLDLANTDENLPPWVDPEKCRKQLRKSLAEAIISARKQGWRFKIEKETKEKR